jgi:hypothetical protein
LLGIFFKTNFCPLEHLFLLFEAAKFARTKFCRWIFKHCPGEAQLSAVQGVFIRGTGAKADELLPKKLFFSCSKLSLRTLWLAPPAPGASHSCAAHALHYHEASGQASAKGGLVLSKAD